MTQPAPTTRPEPVDLADGIPDRVSTPSRWRFLWVLVIFAMWVGVLLYMLLGHLPKGAK